LTVVFLKDSAKTYNRHSENVHMHQGEFLEAKFCAVVCKIKEEGGAFSTSIRIYYMKDMKKPLIYLKSKRIYKFQLGFYERESPKDIGKIKFVLKG
jgi:hypothetical protein